MSSVKSVYRKIFYSPDIILSYNHICSVCSNDINIAGHVFGEIKKICIASLQKVYFQFNNFAINAYPSDWFLLMESPLNETVNSSV